MSLPFFPKPKILYNIFFNLSIPAKIPHKILLIFLIFLDKTTKNMLYSNYTKKQTISLHTISYFFLFTHTLYFILYILYFLFKLKQRFAFSVSITLLTRCRHRKRSFIRVKVPSFNGFWCEIQYLQKN